LLWKLVKKEVLNKTLDFRFLISSVIGLCLIVLTTFILSEQYIKQVDQYNEFINADKEALNDIKAFSQLRLNAHRPPTPLSIFNKGVSPQLDNSMGITHVSVPRQGVETESENPFMKIFQFFDLTTIFQIVLSLLAILLVYDAISGEREEGTLKAVLSNSIARYQILLSKLTASLIGLAIPLFLSLLVSLLIMTLVYNIVFNADQWIRIGLIVLSTFLFLGFFVTGGLLVSSLVKHASVSLIWLLFIWVVTVFIQPNLGSYLAATVTSIPSRKKIESAITQVWEELQEKREKIEQEIQKEVPGDPWHSDQSGGWPFYHCFDGNRTGLYRYVLRTQRIQPLYVDYAEREWQAYQGEYHVFLNRQYSHQKFFDRFFPAALFKRITSSLAQTSIENHEAFIDQARQYRQSYLSYLIDERKVFSGHANLYFTQQTMEQIQKSDFAERMREAGGPGKNMVSYDRDYYDPLDLTGLPQFQFQSIALSQSIRYVLLDTVLLLCLSIVLFYLCSVAMNRYDVRSN